MKISLRLLKQCGQHSLPNALNKASPTQIALFSLALLFAAGFLPVRAAEHGTLQAGAARVDITPAADAALVMSGYADRKEGFKGIHDHIYARAIVVSDGARTAAIVSWELIGVPDAVWEVT